MEFMGGARMAATAFNLQNLRGQSLLFRCLETGFVTTAPALTRYQQGRGIDPSRRELVGVRPEQWCRSRPVTICEHCGPWPKNLVQAAKIYQDEGQVMINQLPPLSVLYTKVLA